MRMLVALLVALVRPAAGQPVGYDPTFGMRTGNNTKTCPAMRMGQTWEVKQHWFSCIATSDIGPLLSNSYGAKPAPYEDEELTNPYGDTATIRIDFKKSTLGMRGKLFNIRLPSPDPEDPEQGELISTSQDDLYSTRQDRTIVYDCNFNIIGYFEQPYYFGSTYGNTASGHSGNTRIANPVQYYILDKDGFALARVEKATWEVKNYYIKPCLNNPPTTDTTRCQVAPIIDGIENRAVKLNKNIMNVHERWEVTILQPQLVVDPPLYADPRMLTEIIIRESGVGTSWCVTGIILLVVLGLCCCSCMAFGIYQYATKPRNREAQRLFNQDPVAYNAVPGAGNDAQARVDQFVDATGAERRVAQMYLQRTQFDVQAATNEYFQDQEAQPVVVAEPLPAGEVVVAGAPQGDLP